MRKKFVIVLCFTVLYAICSSAQEQSGRERLSIGSGWKFYKYKSSDKADSLIYDIRPSVEENIDLRPADAKPTEAVKIDAEKPVLKSWILPSGNAFIADPSMRFTPPQGNPGENFPFVQNDFDDNSWEDINIPHDWAIKGPFYKGWNTEIGGGMGRLPVQGVGWYRKKIVIPSSDQGKSIYLDIDGAMSYAMVWVNGKLAGGWPNGYLSWRLDITPYLKPGKPNQIAIRVDNPPASSRWYPGAGIYRNIWLVKTSPVHVSHWGTFINCRDVSKTSAVIDLRLALENNSKKTQHLEINTAVFALHTNDARAGAPAAVFKEVKKSIRANTVDTIFSSLVLANPKLWGPPPSQSPNRYTAVTTISSKGRILDTYETKFGIRDLRFDPEKGVFVNGEHIYIKGANQHHDLGALGAAFNVRAAERQLETLREMGCNAVRMAHNPPAPELLELTDRMGFLVINEIFDSWALKKTPLDFHLIFPDWHEQDLRSLMRRDRNHPSIIIWSFGNEVGEQYTGEEGAALARKLYNIAKSEDPHRPTTLGMNYAKPDMPLPAVPDIIGLNYQGEGIRNGPAYEGLKGITTPPVYPQFHKKFPDKVIISTENAAAVSSRGEYLFPVFEGLSAPVKDGSGGDPKKLQVSAYELYTTEFGSSADKVFSSLEQHPYVAGGFVWSGWDYLGEPTPYYLARSSYFGVIDLAGFKKDRFYLYQSHWRPELPMAHILPHWNWPERVSQTTPVHVFTSGDEAELFLNEKSLGRKKKGQYEYRLRWDDVKYEPGELKVIAYKNGEKWAENSVRTTLLPEKLSMSIDRQNIKNDGKDLSFVTVSIKDSRNDIVPRANSLIKFSIEGPGEIAGTDNGDPANFVSFTSTQREAFNGLCLVIIRAKSGESGTIKLKAESEGLESTSVLIKSIDPGDTNID